MPHVKHLAEMGWEVHVSSADDGDGVLDHANNAEIGVHECAGENTDEQGGINLLVEQRQKNCNDGREQGPNRAIQRSDIHNCFLSLIPGFIGIFYSRLHTSAGRQPFHIVSYISDRVNRFTGLYEKRLLPTGETVFL